MDEVKGRDVSPVTETELKATARKIKAGRAAGSDLVKSTLHLRLYPNQS